MAKENNYLQVPVINKTLSLFKRDPNNPKAIMPEPDSNIKELLRKNEHVFTVKTDGTCGMVLSIYGAFTLMRRQDIRISSRNYDRVLANGEIHQVAGMNCFVTSIVRGVGKSEIEVPLYIFQLDDELKPELENSTHIIGFTPLRHNYGDDKNVISAVEGTNGGPGMKLYTTVFNGSLDIPVRAIPVEELMGDKLLLTVEIMGSKISNKYGFKNDRHFINPHGSITYPSDFNIPTDYNTLKNWFENDKNDRWADVEGFVIHIPSYNRRFKVHRGHVGLEQTWMKKKESGINFIFE